MSHHLGADYTRDKDKTLVCQPKRFIDRLLESYQSMFKQDPPKTMRSPLETNDLPELDDTELLTGESILHYLTKIGQLQWLVTPGRFDIHAQVTTMSRFRSSPRKGHLDRIPSTTPGADPPRDARDSGSARSHSTHLETSSSDRP